MYKRQDIAWKTLKQLVPRIWIKSKNESDLKIELVNGSMIVLKGTENAMALRGRSLSGCVLDEAAFMDSGVWFEVLRPALADKQGWALFISTPEGTASWFYDLWCFAGEEENDWKRWSYTTIEGGNVPPEEVEAARSQLDPRTFRQEFEASFENLSGLVAINFSDENISKSAEDIPQLPLWIGLDFNVDNMSAVFGIRVDEELHIFDELIMTNAPPGTSPTKSTTASPWSAKKTSPPTPLERQEKPPASASPTTPSCANPASRYPPPAPPGTVSYTHLTLPTICSV